MTVFSTLTARAAILLAALMIAGSAAALDIACCGDGPGPTPPDGPNEFAAPEIDNDPEPEEASDNGGGESVFEQLVDDCREAGGYMLRGNRCFDREGTELAI